jgi:hypothetical protein
MYPLMYPHKFYNQANWLQGSIILGCRFRGVWMGRLLDRKGNFVVILQGLSPPTPARAGQRCRQPGPPPICCSRTTPARSGTSRSSAPFPVRGRGCR